MSRDKIKIVLVEDEPEIINLYTLKLKEAGFDVTHVIDGREVSSVVKKVNPDLILLDLVIPHLDGYQVLSVLRQDPETKDYLVYAWSNLTQKKEIDQAKKLGVNGYLIKSDFTPSILADKIREILGNKKKNKN